MWNHQHKRSKRKQFKRMHKSYVDRHKRADQLRLQVSQSWNRACDFDGIDPEATIVDFSDNNPHRITYDAALSALWEYLGY